MAAANGVHIEHLHTRSGTGGFERSTEARNARADDQDVGRAVLPRNRQSSGNKSETSRREIAAPPSLRTCHNIQQRPERPLSCNRIPGRHVGRHI